MFINGIKNEEIVEEVYEENDIDVLIKDVLENYFFISFSFRSK